MALVLVATAPHTSQAVEAAVEAAATLEVEAAEPAGVVAVVEVADHRLLLARTLQMWCTQLG